MGLASNGPGYTQRSRGISPSGVLADHGTTSNQPTLFPPAVFTGHGLQGQTQQSVTGGQQAQFTGIRPAANPNQRRQLSNAPQTSAHTRYPRVDFSDRSRNGSYQSTQPSRQNVMGPPPANVNSPVLQVPTNLYAAAQNIPSPVDRNNVVVGNGPVYVGYNTGPWKFSPAQNQRAKSRDWKVGDVVSHELVRQAWNEPAWHWVDKPNGFWKYNSKDIFFVPGKERRNRDPGTTYGHQTVPAVQFLNRFGVIDEIYEDDALYGRSAKVIPMFSYGGSGMYDKSTGRAKPASWCAEHLPIMHHNEAVQKEQDIQNRNDLPETKDKLKALDRKCPHPDIFWKDLVRLTADSFFHPEQGSHLRLSATTMVQLQDPRIKYMGELTPDSWAFVRGARAKIQEIASLGPEHRGNVDYSVYTWMENLDKNKVLHRQQRRETQSGQVNSASSSSRGSDTVATDSEQPSPATSRKRKASELNSAPDPVKVETENILNLRFLLQNMSVEERRQALEMLHDIRQTSYDESVAMSIETAATDVGEEVEPAAKRSKLNDAVDSITRKIIDT